MSNEIKIYVADQQRPTEETGLHRQDKAGLWKERQLRTSGCRLPERLRFSLRQPVRYAGHR